jgi:hypothetical protein
VEELEDRRVLAATPPSFVGLAVTSPINENAFAELTGNLSDPTLGLSFSVQVNWGDSSPVETFTFGPSTAVLTPIDLTHQYVGNPPGHPSQTYTINLTATASDNLTGTGTIPVTVNSVPPTLDALQATPTVDNGYTTLTGFILDQSPVHSYTLAVSWGDGTSADVFTYPAGTTSFDLTHQYLEAAPDSSGNTFRISVTVTDDEGLTGTGSTAVTVTDVPPTLDALQATPVSIGNPTTLTGFVLDQGTLNTHTLTINWGDNTPPQAISLAAGVTTFSVPHTYANSPPGQLSGNFTINITVADNHGGTGTGSTTVLVSKQPPTVTLAGSNTAEPGGLYFLNLTYIVPGTDAISSTIVNWGDGTVETFTGAPPQVVHRFPLTSASFTISAQVVNADGTFASANTLTVTTRFSSAGQNLVTAQFFDLLGHPPDTTTLTTLGNSLDHGLITPFQVAGDIESSPEFRMREVQTLYQRTLGRAPDAAGLNNGTMFLLSGGTLKRLQAALLGSDEFFAKNGGSGGFLEGLYLSVLGRDVEPAVVAAIDGRVNQGSAARTQIALSVVQSVEADTLTVKILYQQYLKRPADPLGLALDVDALQHGAPEEAIIAVLISSPEYIQAHR